MANPPPLPPSAGKPRPKPQPVSGQQQPKPAVNQSPSSTPSRHWLFRLRPSSIIAAAVVLGVVVLLLLPSKPGVPAGTESKPTPNGGAASGTVSVPAEQSAPALTREDAITQATIAYIMAPFDQRFNYVVNGEALKESMAKYYAHDVHDVTKVRVAGITFVNDSEAIADTIITPHDGKDAAPYPECLRKQGGRWLIDWPANTGLNPMRLTVFSATRPSDPITMRLNAWLSQYYDPGASERDKRELYCIALNDIYDDERLTGYVPRESTVGKKLFDLLKDGNAHPITVTIQRIGGDSEAVAILGLVSSTWFIDQQPREPASELTDVERFTAELKSDHRSERVDALANLMKVGPDARESLPDIVKALDDPEPQVRRFAIQAVGAIGPPAATAIPKIQGMFVSKDRLFTREPEAASYVIPYIAKIGRPAVPLLAVIALRGQANVTDDALAKWQSLEAAPFIMDSRTGNYMRDIAPRLIACQLLAKISGADALPVILKLAPEANGPTVAGHKLPKGMREAPGNGAIHTIVVAIGDAGINDPQAIAILESHRRTFPDEVDTALRKIAPAGNQPH